MSLKKKFVGLTVQSAMENDPELYRVISSVRHLQHELDIKPFLENYHWTKLPR